MPQQWCLVMHSDLGNSTAAMQVRTCTSKSVQSQSMTETTSVSTSPSLAHLHASSCSSKDCIHNRLAALKRKAGPKHANWTPVHAAYYRVNKTSFILFKCLLVLHHARAYSETAEIIVMTMFKHEHQIGFSPWLKALRCALVA